MYIPTYRDIEELRIFYVHFVFWFVYVIYCETVGCCKISTERAIIAIVGDKYCTCPWKNTQHTHSISTN